MRSRIEHLRLLCSTHGLNAFLITFAPHLRYFSNFTGSYGVGLVTRSAAYLVTDSRYATQARKEVQGWRILISEDSLFDEIFRAKLLRIGWRIGFDGNTLPYLTYQALTTKFPRVRFVSKGSLIDTIIAVKNRSELQYIQRAVEITDTVFRELLSMIKPGTTELDIAAEISYRHQKYGAESDAFQPIVASGLRSALPHGRATSKKIHKGDLLTLDFGCVYRGYCSDLTRTLVIGRATAEQKKIYRIVLDAQLRAIEHAKSGVMARDLDTIARSSITRRGYGRYFRHSLGHGLGLQIHEPPRISSRSTARLTSGNVITIEPGIYIPAFGGVRIEDDVVIRNSHCEVLTRSPKELLTL